MEILCSKCGIRLIDGQPCNCQTNVSEQQETIQESPVQPVQQSESVSSNLLNQQRRVFINLLKGIFKDPVEALSSYVNGDNMILSLILIALQVLTTSLFACFMLIYNMGFGVISEIIGTFFQSLFMTFIFSILMIGVLIGGLFIIAAVSKNKADFKKIINIVATRSFASIPFSIVAILFGFISITFGIGLFIVSEFFAVMFLYHSIKSVFELSEKVLTFAIPLLFIVLIFVWSVFANVAMRTVFESLIGGYISKFFGGLVNVH